MGSTHAFAKISGFKRVSTCLSCRKRFTATKKNIHFCEECAKKRANSAEE